MVTEAEYTKALNARSWAFIIRKASVPTFACAFAVLYAFHCRKHENQTTTTFRNKSKLFGGLKNPQY